METLRPSGATVGVHPGAQGGGQVLARGPKADSGFLQPPRLCPDSAHLLLPLGTQAAGPSPLRQGQLSSAGTAGCSSQTAAVRGGAVQRPRSTALAAAHPPARAHPPATLRRVRAPADSDWCRSRAGASSPSLLHFCRVALPGLRAQGAEDPEDHGGDARMDAGGEAGTGRFVLDAG